MKASFICALFLTATISSAALARDPIGIPGPEDQSLWWRYYGAGAAAMKQHKTSVARQYWFGALTELEKFMPNASKGKKDVHLAIKMSVLEQGLESLYPNDWSKEKGSEAELMKRQEEQVNVLYRIAQLNQHYVRPDDLLVSKSVERYTKAREDLKKAQDEAAKKPGQQSSSSNGNTTEHDASANAGKPDDTSAPK